MHIKQLYTFRPCNKWYILKFFKNVSVATHISTLYPYQLSIFVVCRIHYSVTVYVISYPEFSLCLQCNSFFNPQHVSIWNILVQNLFIQHFIRYFINIFRPLALYGAHPCIPIFGNFVAPHIIFVIQCCTYPMFNVMNFGSHVIESG